MNRTIKFRIWCKTTKHFTDSPFVASSGGQLLWLHTGNKISISNLDQGEYVLQEFTGLKDKNSKEIYEGDICKYKNIYGIQKRPVVFKWGSFKLDGIKGAVCEEYVGHYSKGLEVIGNIFENPDLLK